MLGMPSWDGTVVRVLFTCMLPGFKSLNWAFTRDPWVFPRGGTPKGVTNMGMTRALFDP